MHWLDSGLWKVNSCAGKMKNFQGRFVRSVMCHSCTEVLFVCAFRKLDCRTGVDFEAQTEVSIEREMEITMIEQVSCGLSVSRPSVRVRRQTSGLWEETSSHWQFKISVHSLDIFTYWCIITLSCPECLSLFILVSPWEFREFWRINETNSLTLPMLSVIFVVHKDKLHLIWKSLL